MLDFLFFHKWSHSLLCLHLKKLQKQLAKQNKNWETYMLFSLYLIQGFSLKFLNNTPCQTNWESEIAGRLDHNTFTIFKCVIFIIFGGW